MPKSNGDDANMDELSKKLVDDLRSYVRSLVPHCILTRPWFDMTDKLVYVTDVAMREQRLPRKADPGTLWDRDELTVRFLLEEGKLNLCLRLMTEYSQFTRTPTYSTTVQQVSTEMSVDKKVIENRLESFEHSMGMLLSCAFKSVESLQTIDMPLLLEHVKDVLQAFNTRDDQPTGDLEKRQESLVISYINSIFRYLEELPEDRIMELVEEHDIVGLLVDVLSKHGTTYSRRVVEVTCATLSLAMDSEAYKTHKERYVGSEERKLALIKVREQFLAELEKDYESRRRFTALLRQIDSFAMQVGR